LAKWSKSFDLSVPTVRLCYIPEQVVYVKFFSITLRYLITSKDIANEKVIKNFVQFLIVLCDEVHLVLRTHIQSE